MFFKRHLNSFNIYILILIITSSIIITGVPEFPIINFIIYLFIHFLLIYLGFYHYRLALYFIYFFIGILFDIYFLNEIGTHIITFMILIIFIRLLKKTVILLNPRKIYFLFTFILLFVLFFEMLVSLILFKFSFDFTYLLMNIILSLLISFPIFYLFNKIDSFD